MLHAVPAGEYVSSHIPVVESQTYPLTHGGAIGLGPQALIIGTIFFA